MARSARLDPLGLTWSERPVPTPIEAALEAALLRELHAEWGLENYKSFKKRMLPPQIVLIDHASFLGRWIRTTRVLEIARKLVRDRSWGIVKEVLRHEMAHQFVDEVLGIHDETAHGPTFRRVCAELGVDDAARGMPEAVDQEEERITEKIRKLLALAESPEPNEAAAALAAAQRLMAKYNIDLDARRAEKGYTVRFLGEATGRVREPARILAGILAQHFFVEAIWISVYRPDAGKRGTLLEISGTAANVSLAEYVHGYVLHAGERLWLAHKRVFGIRGDRDRIGFLSGVMSGFAEKLRSEAKSQRGEGLVHVKDAGLDAYFRRRHPQVRSVRYGGEARGSSFLNGREEGRKLQVAPALSKGATGPKLLPGRR